MFVVNEKEFPDSRVVAHLDRDRCDGCAICVDICPTGALELVNNKKRPGKKVIFIQAKKCHGCGVCEGACPKEAIFIPGLSISELRSYVHKAIAEIYQEVGIGVCGQTPF